MFGGVDTVTYRLTVTGGGSIRKCGGLSQSSWLLVHGIIQSYLLEVDLYMRHMH